LRYQKRQRLNTLLLLAAAGVRPTMELAAAGVN
jgi:hypothetical protein